ncbi:hypothetical protein [Roseibium album]|uniref:hypothetical protein n=1 Tax=Roseibium album TaxID=311410 RepID=UPI00391D27B8
MTGWPEVSDTVFPGDTDNGDGTFSRPAPLPVTAKEVKEEAKRRILEIAPEWKQRNLTARAAELAIKGTANWNEEEQAEVTAGQAVWDMVKAIRAASDVLEAMKLIPLNFRDDENWPSV